MMHLSIALLHLAIVRVPPALMAQSGCAARPVWTRVSEVRAQAPDAAAPVMDGASADGEAVATMRRAGFALLTRAAEGATYITSGSDRDELIKLATAAEQAAKAADATPTWPQCAEALCDGRWRLVATTRTGGSELLQQMGKQPALGTFRVEQDWSQRDGSLRCDNVVTVGRPNGGLLSAWTLLPAGGQSSLRLQHSARVVNDGAQANVPLRIAIELDALLLDGNRAAGEPVERIVSLPLPPQLLPGLPPPPSLSSLPLPGLAEAGTFDVTYMDESVRIVRAASNVLRIFARDQISANDELPTW